MSGDKKTTNVYIDKELWMKAEIYKACHPEIKSMSHLIELALVAFLDNFEYKVTK